MNKTKLGINEYLFVALIFVGAIWGVTPMLGLMLFAAVVEKSEIINAGSRMALIIKVGFLLVQSCLNFIEEIVRTFADDASGFYRVMNKIDYFLDAALLDDSNYPDPSRKTLSFHPNDCRGTVVIALDDFERYLSAVGNTYEYIQLY